MPIELPPDFRTRMAEQLGRVEAERLFVALEDKSPISIQRHPSKGKNLRGNLATVPWYERGQYLPERPSFTHDPLFQAGAYYVQEAGSMLVAWLLTQLDLPDRPWRVLDLCGAPGGKSCLLAANMPEGSLLVANEVIKSRASILRFNLAKWGLPGCWTTQLDPASLASLGPFFDLILVDAPCSGEGLFRKDPAARSEWSPEKADLCAARQGRILRSAVKLLRPGGRLIYSTCTYNPAENEAQVGFLEESGLTRVGHQPPPAWGIHYESGTYQLYPHRTRAEGFFAAALTSSTQQPPAEPNLATRQISSGTRRSQKQKKARSAFPHWSALAKRDHHLIDPWLARPENFDYFQDRQSRIYALSRSLLADAQFLAGRLGRIDLGFPLGQIKGGQLIPAPELALHTELRKEVPHLEVDEKTALDLLRKETPTLAGFQSGFQLITYQGLGLLWIKGLGKRYNNYWPAAWRIRT